MYPVLGDASGLKKNYRRRGFPLASGIIPLGNLGVPSLPCPLLADIGGRNITTEPPGCRYGLCAFSGIRVSNNLFLCSCQGIEKGYESYLI